MPKRRNVFKTQISKYTNDVNMWRNVHDRWIYPNQHRRTRSKFCK